MQFFAKILALVCVSAFLMLTGCNSGGADEATQAAAGDSKPAVVVGAKSGNMAPNFQLEKIAGGTLDLYSLRGKVVIVDFWDTWCPPCKKALPHLQALSEEYKDEVVVVGVAFGRFGIEAVRDFIKQGGLTFEIVMSDPQYAVARDFGGVQSIPTTFLIDAEGKIVTQWTGYHEKAVYEAGIKQALGT